jgi:rhodanese-related sulfurtransferase/DNA-binding transcriptional ArsR family regulator
MEDEIFDNTRLAGARRMSPPVEIKRAVNEQFARIAKAIAHPKRVEILDLLAQGERGVDAIAAATALGVTTASAHLQALRRARLVETRRVGTRVIYRLAGPDVSALLGALRDVAAARLAEVAQLEHDYFRARDELEPMSRDDLLARARDGDVVVVDVRPRVEYDAGHIPGALSVPLDQLEARLSEVPQNREVVAYCRGPYCVLAPEAVVMLRAHGRRARRLVDGLPEWRLAGLPIAVGQEEVSG